MVPVRLTTRAALALTFVLVLAIAITFSPPAVSSGIIDGCYSTATPVGFPAAIAVCPGGDGQTLADVGARIDLIVRDPSGYAIPSFPMVDIWLTGCEAQYPPLCYYQTGYADDNTDADGATTISSTMAIGGTDSGVHILIQALPVLEKPDCLVSECLPLTYRSADINADRVVNLADVSLFAQAFPPNPYDDAVDYNFDGVIGLPDMAFFAAHLGHGCE